jgi:hypothetical protein
MVRRPRLRVESDDHFEEREARIAEIMARVQHHQDQAAKHLAEAKKLKARLHPPKRNRAAKR